MLISSAWAQAQNAAAKAPNPIMQFVPLILIFMVFYFLVLRPQKKRMQEEDNFIKSLAKGVEVYTKSGIVGVVQGLAEQFVTLEVAEGVKIKVVRNQIAGPVKNLLTAAKTESKKVEGKK